MSEAILLSAGTIEITTKVARFDNVSYQIANIGSVAVYVTRQLNALAILLFLAAVLVGFATNNLAQQNSDQTYTALGITLALGVGAVVVQALWPRLTFTFILKTSSADTHKLVSKDGEHLKKLRAAVEEAFVRRI
jgi:hypothetical protein